jgi:DNA ligase-1
MQGGYMTDVSFYRQPMLAHEYTKHKHKLKCDNLYLQPKLDGIRCVAYYDFDRNTYVLLSRNGNEFGFMKHIVYKLNEFKEVLEYSILDGELYCAHMDFEEIVSRVQQKLNPHPQENEIQYHIYDKVSPLNEEGRQSWLDDMECKGVFNEHPLNRVYTLKVKNDINIKTYHDMFVADGYEGVMVRADNGLYWNGKRSMTLLKYKEFMDGEFEILDCIEGDGKLKNALGVFVVKVNDNITCEVKLKTTEDELRRMWTIKEEFIGKVLTAKYQGYTSKGKLRFPIGLAIRSYE